LSKNVEGLALSVEAGSASKVRMSSGRQTSLQALLFVHDQRYNYLVIYKY
jgi:hypothetical protein